MPEDLFRFKQFKINQIGATLKVCTDSCLFGAWIAQNYKGLKVLDVGTGTGLLALMYAQKNPKSHILALEIDTESAALSKNNFMQSPWSQRLESKCISLQDFVKEYKDSRFDLLFCNPPFFENQLPSKKHQHKLAKHSACLTKTELIFSFTQLLSENGTVCVLLPPYEATTFAEMAKDAGFHLKENVTIRNKTGQAAFRHILCFGKKEGNLILSELTIYQSDKIYSPEFQALLNNYYLAL